MYTTYQQHVHITQVSHVLVHEALEVIEDLTSKSKDCRSGSQQALFEDKLSPCVSTVHGGKVLLFRKQQRCIKEENRLMPIAEAWC